MYKYKGQNKIMTEENKMYMGLLQKKLSRSEWNTIEIPVNKAEKDILELIIDGFKNVNIKQNKSLSLFSFLKIQYTENIEDYLYEKYFQSRINKLRQEYNKQIDPSAGTEKTQLKPNIKTIDKLRLDRYDDKLLMTNDLYDFLLLNLMENMVYKSNDFHHSYFTLFKLVRNNISHVNRHIIEFANELLTQYKPRVDVLKIIENSVTAIEKNTYLLKYADLVLYQHQKQIFTICKLEYPKLILYIAPTGTGKTITPIALSERKRILFVCAARHVGIALARSAISVNKKVAFAFGCESADDIRLHYYAAKDYSINKKTGGIGKVDNSVGDLVEIMICDIKSYLTAMYYMLAFHPKEELLLYWDEPTITMDYEEHEFHPIIQEIWRENKIPTIVFSSATLPKENELTETISDFLNKFTNGKIYSILSHDCKKSIPIINKEGYVVMPHYLYSNFADMKRCIEHCNQYLTLLRYFDLHEVSTFLSYCLTNNLIKDKENLLCFWFDDFDDITMTNLKRFYLDVMGKIEEADWNTIYHYFQEKRQPILVENNSIEDTTLLYKSKSVGPEISETSKLSGKSLKRVASLVEPQNIIKKGTSGIYVTTKDAYTLTDGPTIFIIDDIDKIAKFCIQQANIPASVMDDIANKIEENNILNQKIDEMEKIVENLKEKTENHTKNEGSGRNKGSKDLRKLNREVDESKQHKSEISRLTNEMNTLRSMIKSTCLNDTFIPNKYLHLQKWAKGLDIKNSFTSNIDDVIIQEIMGLHGVENSWKILLMMGIGVFKNHTNVSYIEIMKRLADEQKLFMIVATSDYIYGTNYQFCHGYISKDLSLTQEKIIQAMGRIGRNNIQQNYTIRFRDDTQIERIFMPDANKPEVRNMNRLFSGSI
jgi:hypothetical protein